MLERLTDRSTDIVVATDRKGRVVYYNDGASKSLGYDPQEILGKFVGAFYPSVEEARRVAQAMRDPDQFAPGVVESFQTSFMTVSGEEIPVALSGALKKNKTLKVLRLDRNAVGEAGAAALADMLLVNKGLTSLGLSASKIGDKGAIAIGKTLRTGFDQGKEYALRELYMSGNHFSDRVMEIWAKTLVPRNKLRPCHLVAVSFSATHLGDGAGKHLLKAIKASSDISNTVGAFADVGGDDETCHQKPLTLDIQGNGFTDTMQIKLFDEAKVTAARAREGGTCREIRLLMTKADKAHKVTRAEDDDEQAPTVS